MRLTCTPVLFSIPSSNIGIDEDDAGDYELGWFKDVEIDYTGDGKIMMKISFEFGLWRDSLYEVH